MPGILLSSHICVDLKEEGGACLSTGISKHKSHLVDK